MRLKEKNFQDAGWSALLKDHQKKWILGAAGVVLFAGIVSGSVCYGMFLHKTGAAYKFNRLVHAGLRVVPNYLESLWARPGRITIDIAYKNYQKILYKRKVALERGALITEADDYVPATIRYRDKRLKAKIRLKGDLVDQLIGDKWSFRIKIKGNQTLFGMRAFSIQDPRQRNYLYEWLLHRAMKREGVIGLRYDFVDVTLNGRHLGIFALEEHFEKRLIENNARWEGPIVCYGEGVSSLNDTYFGPALEHMFAKQGDFYSARVDLYTPTRTLADPALRDQFRVARNLLESFRREKAETCDVFACPVLARYYALLDLMNARHAAKYGNLKFYYNPLTLKLEPICFDAEFVGQEAIYAAGIYAENWFEDVDNPARIMFKDNRFFALYLKELERMSQPSYLDALFRDLKPEAREKLAILHRDYPYAELDPATFYAKQEYIKKVLTLPVSINPYFKKVFTQDGKREVVLAVGNIRTVPVRIIGLTLPDGTKCPPVRQDVVLNPSFPHQPIAMETVVFAVPETSGWKGDDPAGLTVQFSLDGVSTIRSETVIPWPDFDPAMEAVQEMRRPSDLTTFPFLRVDDSDKTITIKPGRWELARNLIIPAGYRVLCGQGTRLDLRQEAKIVSRSPFEFIGTAENPIVVTSSDSTGEGVAVLNAGKKSVFRHVRFHNLSNPKAKGWGMTGAVTFYESDVEFHDCQFLENRCEDGVNIVRSNFLVDKCLFNKTFSDAFDSDFSRGTIQDTVFSECGNDAIDVSGTTVEVFDTSIDVTGDKGLSVGERSVMEAHDVSVKKAPIGMASKDQSRLHVWHSRIAQCPVGLALYQKKPEYGPAVLTAEDLTLTDVPVPYQVEERSRLTVDKKTIAPTLKWGEAYMDKEKAPK